MKQQHGFNFPFTQRITLKTETTFKPKLASLLANTLFENLSSFGGILQKLLWDKKCWDSKSSAIS